MPISRPEHDADARLLSARFSLLLLAQALFGLSFSTYFLIPKYLQVELGANPTTIGWVSGTAWTTSVLSVPLTGTLVDRVGRRRVAGLGALSMVIGCCLFATSEDVGPLLFAARVLQGAGFSFFFVAASTLAVDLAPPARLSQAIGWFGGMMVMTNALSPAVAEPLAELVGWRWVFWATAGFAALAGLAASQLGPGASRPKPSASPFRAVLSIQKLRPIWFVSALAGFLFGATITFSGPWALDAGFEQVSTFFIAYACASASVRFLLGGLADHWGRLPVAMAAMAVYGLAPLLLVDVAQVGLILPGVALGVAQGLYYPALNAVAIEWSAATVRATVMALYNGAFNVGFTVGSIGMGPVVEAWGYPLMFGTAAGCAVAAILTMTRIAAASSQD